jgi:hypothetical protein
VNSAPLTLSVLTPRSIVDIAAAARAAQANVAALKTSWCKRTQQNPAEHDIRTPSPGAVHQFREMLIDWRVIRDYSLEEIALRLRQVWGEFCALCWCFPFVDPQKPIDFERLSPNQAFRCCNDLQEKLHEIQTGLWRLKHEQRVRFDATARGTLEFQREHEIALARPVMIYGQNVSQCSDEDLLCGACEYAGMLAALRWATDHRWGWEAPGIMELTVDFDPGLVTQSSSLQ